MAPVNRRPSPLQSVSVRHEHGSAVAHQAVAQRHRMGCRRHRDLRDRDDRRCARGGRRSRVDDDRSSSGDVVVDVLQPVPIDDQGTKIGVDGDRELALRMQVVDRQDPTVRWGPRDRASRVLQHQADGTSRHPHEDERRPAVRQDRHRMRQKGGRAVEREPDLAGEGGALLDRHPGVVLDLLARHRRTVVTARQVEA